jgi:hypothetical protein
MSSKNSIGFSLMENILRNGSGSRFFVRGRRFKTIDKDELVGIMATKNTTVSRQDIIAVIDLLQEC